MGNTPASPKKANEQRPVSTELDLLPLKERFNQLAGPPANGPSEHGNGDYPPGETKERFVLLENCSGLVGPRAVQVAVRLYRVLDAGGDGKLDFEATLPGTWSQEALYSLSEFRYIFFSLAYERRLLTRTRQSLLHPVESSLPTYKRTKFSGSNNPTQEFSSAACLLEGSPDDDKLTLLFKMYGDASKGGLVGREGIQAFILDILAASPPPFAPLEKIEHQCNGGTNGKDLDRTPAVHARRDDSVGGLASGDTGVPQPDFETELEHVLAKMAGVVLTEHDSDGDGMLTEKEWRSYLRQEEESVRSYLKTLSDSVAKLLLP